MNELDGLLFFWNLTSELYHTIARPVLSLISLLNLAIFQLDSDKQSQ
jgi:hypothetical protein